MGLFKQRGKHSANEANADATQALDQGSFGNEQTGLIDASASNESDSFSNQETIALDKSAIVNSPTASLGSTDQVESEPTQAMPRLDLPSLDPPALGASAGDEAKPTAYMAGYPPAVQAPLPNNGAYVPPISAVPPEKGRHRGVKAFVITFVILGCILAGVYCGIAMMFSTQFMPNTRIGGIDVSMKQDDEVVELLNKVPEQYTIDVLGNDFSLRMTGADVGMTIDSEAIVKTMHADQNQWYWPWYVSATNHDETELLKTSFDEKASSDIVAEAVKSYNKNADKPTDASIYYDESSQTFAIKPDEVGTQLDTEAVQKTVNNAITEMQSKVELTDEQLKQPSLRADDEKLVSSADMANGLMSAHLTLKINGNPVDEIGKEALSKFIEIKNTFDVSLNTDELAQWVNNLAASYNTIGMERTYTRADGKVITVSGGTYGWEVDQGALSASIMDAIKAGGEAEIDIPCIDSANIYTGRGQRDWGNRYIDVDLSEQHAYFYGDDGRIIWQADIITGIPDGEHDTPAGVWYIIMKESPSTLIGYVPGTDNKVVEYEETVTYWMPFVGNGVGFHDASWQPDFGGSMYAEGYGSHGCINLSTSDASALYKIIQPNDVVVVHY